MNDAPIQKQNVPCQLPLGSRNCKIDHQKSHHMLKLIQFNEFMYMFDMFYCKSTEKYDEI